MLQSLADDVINGKELTVQSMTEIRVPSILIMQYYARMFCINLAMTGHMRPEDWYNMYMLAVFGRDSKNPSTGQADLFKNPPRVRVPGLNNLRDVMWNLDALLKGHRDASGDSEENRTTCLTGILCIVKGMQLKKARGRKSNASDDVNTSIIYDLNALVDGKGGVMSAGNAMVLARGFLELYNRLSLHAGSDPLIYRSVAELCGTASAEEAADDESSGGPSFLAEGLSKTLKERTGCCGVKTGMPVSRITKIKGVIPRYSEHAVAVTYKFDEDYGPIKEVSEEGEVLGNMYVDQYACATHLRKDLESSLDCTGAAKHVFTELAPHIGHGPKIQADHYMKPPLD
jgi:hypothetical protein